MALSRICGYNNAHPKILGEFFDEGSYLKGLVQGDHLDAYLRAVETYELNPTISPVVGEYFSPKIMDHFGYDEANLRF